MASSAGADKADLGPQAAATSKLSPTLPLENSEAPKSSLKTAVPPTEDQEETEVRWLGHKLCMCIIEARQCRSGLQILSQIGELKV